MKKLIAVLSIFVFAVGLVLPAAAADIPSEVTLIKNVNIFKRFQSDQVNSLK